MYCFYCCKPIYSKQENYREVEKFDGTISYWHDEQPSSKNGGNEAKNCWRRSFKVDPKSLVIRKVYVGTRKH